MQDTQTLKAKIIALLDFLPADSLQLLAEFAAFLRAKSNSAAGVEPPIVQEDKAEMSLETTIGPRDRPIRISNPHLVNHGQLADFKLEIADNSC